MSKSQTEKWLKKAIRCNTDSGLVKEYMHKWVFYVVTFMYITEWAFTVIDITALILEMGKSLIGTFVRSLVMICSFICLTWAVTGYSDLAISIAYDGFRPLYKCEVKELMFSLSLYACTAISSVLVFGDLVHSFL